MEKRQRDAFLAALTEAEQLLQAEQLLHSPNVSAHVQKATKLIIQIARKAPTAALRHVAMKAVSEADSMRTNARDRSNLDQALTDLRLALHEAGSQLDAPSKEHGKRP